jgi:hypothetical protein
LLAAATRLTDDDDASSEILFALWITAKKARGRAKAEKQENEI